MPRMYKWVLEPKDAQTITVPFGTKMMSVAEQHGAPCIWGLVPTRTAALQTAQKLADTADVETKTILMYGTGHEIPDDPRLSFIGTVLLEGGSLVVHIYEVKNAHER